MKTKFSLPLALSLGAFFSLALFSGCATTSSGPAVVTHPDASVNYSSYKSFTVVRPFNMSAVKNPAITPMLLRQMREEAAVAFAAKGLAKAPDATADLLVLAHGGVDEKIDVTDWGFTYGRFGRSRYDVNQYKEGTLLVDVFDAKTKELIWRGSAMAEVSDAPSPEKVKAAIGGVVGPAIPINAV